MIDMTDAILISMLESGWIYKKGDGYGMTPSQRQAVRELRDSQADDDLDLTLIKMLRSLLSGLEEKEIIQS